MAHATRRQLIAALCLLAPLLASPLALAQPLAAPAEPPDSSPLEALSSLAAPAPGPNCSDGVVKDDGSVETGWSWVPSVIRGEYVQEFHSSEFPSRVLDRLCICWLRTRTDVDIDFDLVFYRDVEGQPDEKPFAVVPASAQDVPLGVANGTFYEIQLPEVEIPLGTFYVGPRWNAQVDQFFFLCADTSPTTPKTDLWFIDDRAEGWDSALTTIDPIFAPHRAVMIRPVARGAAVDIPIGATALAVLALVLATCALVRLWKL